MLWIYKDSIYSQSVFERCPGKVVLCQPCQEVSLVHLQCRSCRIICRSRSRSSMPGLPAPSARCRHPAAAEAPGPCKVSTPCCQGVHRWSCRWRCSCRYRCNVSTGAGAADGLEADISKGKDTGKGKVRCNGKGNGKGKGKSKGKGKGNSKAKAWV